VVAPGAIELSGTIAIDTPVYIYTFERSPIFAPYSDAVLDRVKLGSLRAVSSTLVVAEVAVQPYRLGLDAAAREYVDRLARYPNLTLVSPDVEVCRLAAELRGRQRALRFADALHVATAVQVGASAFLTHDKDLPRNLPIRVVQLTDLTGDIQDGDPLC
jgi:predicted nucleic acid-binding protein